MLCIAAFIIFSILGIFSASYRKLAKKGWYCVMRKLTFRPCDINFSQELKGKLLGKLIFTHPKFANFLSRFANVFAFIFVILTIWSTLYVAQAGLNLYVYDTCNPQNVESCSLGGEACGIDSISSTNEFSVWNTIARMPDRWKTWEAEAYVPATVSYYGGYQAEKPVALEIIDPSCVFCKKLGENIKAAGFTSRYNLAYILYPIEISAENYKFPHSYLIASYIEAAKKVPLANATITGDWQLLEKVFGQSPDGRTMQEVFNATEDASKVTTQLHQYLQQIGYTEEQIVTITNLSSSDEVKASLNAQRKIVNEQIRTRKIPTILFDGRRYDRVVDVDKLQ